MRYYLQKFVCFYFKERSTRVFAQYICSSGSNDITCILNICFHVKETVAEHQGSACLASSGRHSGITDFPLGIFSIIAIPSRKV